MASTTRKVVPCVWFGISVAFPKNDPKTSIQPSTLPRGGEDTKIAVWKRQRNPEGGMS